MSAMSRKTNVFSSKSCYSVRSNSALAVCSKAVHSALPKRPVSHAGSADSEVTFHASTIEKIRLLHGILIQAVFANDLEGYGG